MKSFKAYANTKLHAIETVFGHHSQPEPMYAMKTVFGHHSQSKPIKEAVFKKDVNWYDHVTEKDIHDDHDATPNTKDEKPRKQSLIIDKNGTRPF